MLAYVDYFKDGNSNHMWLYHFQEQTHCVPFHVSPGRIRNIFNIPKNVDHIHLGGTASKVIDVQYLRYLKARCNYLTMFYGDAFPKQIDEKIQYANKVFTSHYRPDTVFMPTPFDSNIFKPYDCEKNKDVVFVGNPTDERKKLIQMLRADGINVDCFGHSWGKDTRYIDYFEYSKVISEYKIVLGHTDSSHTHLNRYVSNRFLNTLATNCFHIFRYSNDIEQMAEGKAVWYKDLEECAPLIKKYLKEDTSLISNAGYEYSKLHTFENASRMILDKTIV